MTDVEKLLARRIHNQRVRLRQLEKFQVDRLLHRKMTCQPWRDYVQKVVAENRRLQAAIDAMRH